MKGALLCLLFLMGCEASFNFLFAGRDAQAAFPTKEDLPWLEATRDRV